MTKGEQYKLGFTKSHISGWGILYHCTQTEVTNDSIYLARLLNTLSNHAEPLLEDVETALTGTPEDEYYTFNVSSVDDSVRFLPPNAIINGDYTISLVNLKALLEEWIAFCNS